MKKIISFILILVLLLCSCGTPPTNEAPAPQRDEIIIALLDTGISTVAIQSPQLIQGWNYVTGSADTEDRINHGTSVASVILGCESAGITGAAPDIRVVPLVVTDKINGAMVSVSAEVLAQAIRDSVDKFGASIINISLGIKKDDDALSEAIDYVQAKGALVVSAVGNEGASTDLYYPAAYDGVLGVGSHDKNSKVSDFTQQNGTADILAPGEDIWLASRKGKTYGARGTSYSTGYVSAACALIWQQDLSLTVDEVIQALLSSAQEAEDWLILNIPALP